MKKNYLKPESFTYEVYSAEKISAENGGNIDNGDLKYSGNDNEAW